MSSKILPVLALCCQRSRFYRSRTRTSGSLHETTRERFGELQKLELIPPFSRRSQRRYHVTQAAPAAEESQSSETNRSYLWMLSALLVSGACVGTKLRRERQHLVYAISYSHARTLSPDELDSTEMLRDAAASGNTEAVLTALAGECNPNMSGPKGNRLLHLAAKSGNLETVVALVTNGARVEVANEHGDSPLAIAVKHGHTELVDFLIRAGACTQVCSRYDGTLVSRAIRNGHDDLAIRLINYGVTLDDPRVRCPTELQLAVKRNAVKVVEALLNAGVRRSAGVGDAPLAEAVYNGYTKIVDLLLSPEFEKTDPADPNAGIAAATDLNVLAFAVRVGNTKLIHKLLKAGASPGTGNNELAQVVYAPTALHLAAKSGREEILAVLLKHAKPRDYTIKVSQTGRTPIEQAIQYNNPAALALFLKALGDEINSSKLSASLGYCITAGKGGDYTDLYQTMKPVLLKPDLERLLSIIKDTKAPDLFAQIVSDYLLVEFSSGSPYPGTHMDDLWMMLDGQFLRSPMHNSSTSYTKQEFLFELLEDAVHYGAPVENIRTLANCFTQSGKLEWPEEAWKLLHYAADKGMLETFKALFEHTASLGTLVDSEGNNPAHKAAKNGHIEIAMHIATVKPSLLLDRNKNGELPGDLAPEDQ